jgi:hypothetical protein
MVVRVVPDSMDPVRSSLGGGVAATAVLVVFLTVADLVLAGSDPFAFALFVDLCDVGGPPYCAPGSATEEALSLVWFLALFAVAWPLLFGGFTWGLPGESGTAHGAVFGLSLWAGYAVGVEFLIFRGQETVVGSLPILAVTFLAYLVYGLVLGSVYDRLAAHRTFLSPETDR